MKYNKIILFFIFALPICLGLRFLQLSYIIETDTGFFKQEFAGFGTGITVIIFAFAVALAIFSFISHRSPDNPPEASLPISLFAVLMAISISAELLFGNSVSDAIAWQKFLLYVFGFASVIWLILFAVKDYISFLLPSVSFAIPVLYFVIKIICNFASISSLALISDNILLLGADCLSLLFMLNFGKLYNRIDTERGFRKLLATGLVSSLICFTQSIPNIIFNIVSVSGYHHTAMLTNISVLFTGMFISAFVFSHFGYSNACK